jgi:hypothetical protein
MWRIFEVVRFCLQDVPILSSHDVEVMALVVKTIHGVVQSLELGDLGFLLEWFCV